ncbi:tRNA (uracil-5-)-methyltransferase homolog A [Folsomia candida]|nr:tRNA (uracil-5-)-methyltransferase homolog A [Folsomia candida]
MANVSPSVGVVGLITDGDKVVNEEEELLKMAETESLVGVQEDDTPTTDKPPEGGDGVPEEEKNPYAYLDREEFSSEKYKIEVKGLPKIFGFKEIKKLLSNKLNLNPHKIKTGKSGASYMFVSFKTEEDKLKALEVLNGYKWKNRFLTAGVAKAVEDPLVAKRKRTFEHVDEGVSGFRQEDAESIEDRIQRVTIPWSTVPYAEQLQRKMASTDTIVCSMTSKFIEANFKLRDKYKESKRICPVDEIKPSPVTENYRNKCEFSIGYHPQTNEKMVGFRVSSYKAGSVAIGPISHLIHLPKNMVKVALAFQDYIRGSSLKPFDPENHEGCWKNLTVRTSTNGQVLIILLISAKELKPEEFLEMKNSLIQTFSNNDPQIASCFLKTTETHGQQQKNVPTKLFGDDYITENLLGLKFRISSEAFFQINVPATEVLYTTIGGLLESNPDTTVLDVCCGTGTIGLSIASKCGQVLGLEMIESAVKDARENARLNELADKCQFFAGKAEDTIDAVIGKAQFKNIVAIVDPPRSGLHQRVILLLRKCEKIKHLIYVSCDPKLAMQNFVDLSRPVSKRYVGAPFFPKQIIPVDMFPHCPQTELVIFFERKEMSDL